MKELAMLECNHCKQLVVKKTSNQKYCHECNGPVNHRLGTEKKRLEREKARKLKEAKH